MEDGRGIPEHGGFIDFATGQFLGDPSSSTKWTSAESSIVETIAKPALQGPPGLVYDRPLKRWVPSSRSNLRPDGTEYAYAQAVSTHVGPGTPTRIRAVDIQTGSDRVVYDGGSTDYPVGYSNDGIYIVTARWEASTVGLRLLNPSTGQVKSITSTGAWGSIKGGAAWGFSGEVAGAGAIMDHVDRLDLATGQVTTWYSAPAGVSVSVVGFEWSGDPILYWYRPNEPTTMNFSELLSPGEVRPLMSMSSANDPYTVEFWSDRHGLWLVGHFGVYLLSDQRLHHVIATDWHPGAPGTILYAAGDCD
jgi:hypothetical protein